MRTGVVERAATELLQRLPVVAPRKAQGANANFKDAAQHTTFDDFLHVAHIAVIAVVLMYE